jgi:putative transcriptional regulator
VSIAVVITLIMLVIFPGVSMVRAAFSGQYTALLPFRFSIASPSVGYILSEGELAKGKFLVASRQLRDPSFSETIILLINYNWHGATGLVINKPTKVNLSTVLPEIDGLQQRTDTVYMGGPVSTSQMLLLVRSGNQPEGSNHVFGDIYVSSSRTVLQQMIDDTDEGDRLRIYAGYSGWAPGQLEREVSRGDWHILQADAETIFDKTPSKIWPELIRRSPAQWARVQAN